MGLLQALKRDTQFARDVREGLSAPQKFLSAEYLYDEIGSALFDVITLLPEYGLTRAEERVLSSCAEEIAEKLGPVAAVAELGSGSGRKTEKILEAITRHQPSVSYIAIDVSNSALQSCCSNLNRLRGVRAQGLECTYLEGLSTVRRMRPEAGRLLLLFLGSSIGNFSIDEAYRFVTRARQTLRQGDAFLLGADLIKSPSTLLTAYDDPVGVTAAFNLNVLSRINRELEGNFQLRKFRHEARWRSDKSRIEMHLVSQERQTVSIPGASCVAAFEVGESLWTESSQKFTLSVLDQIAHESGFLPLARWIDEEWPFAESLWLAR